MCSSQGQIFESSSLLTFGGNVAIHVEAFSMKRIVSFYGKLDLRALHFSLPRLLKISLRFSELKSVMLARRASYYFQIQAPLPKYKPYKKDKNRILGSATEYFQTIKICQFAGSFITYNQLYDRAKTHKSRQDLFARSS